MMDTRSRPLPLSPAASSATEPGFALADLPVEAPLDPLAPSEPRAAIAAGRPSGPPPSGEAPAEELVDPERLLLASEHVQTRTPLVLTAAQGSGPAAATNVMPIARPPNAAGASATERPVVAPPTASGASGTVGATAAGGTAIAASRSSELMDRDFIARNQVVERYLSGRLPIKGATDFERFCRENPQLLDELGIPERVNAALRLLEASGKPEPWAQTPKPFWQKIEIVLSLLAAVLVLGISLAIVASGSAHKTRRIAALQIEATERPLDPATSTRDIHLLPGREGASDTPAIIIGGGSEGQLADFRIDESRSPFRLFRITIDRINQGRVGIIDRLAKDSDGNIRIALNSTALGPGDYELTIEGLNWQGAPQPDSWVTIGIRATQ